LALFVLVIELREGDALRQFELLAISDLHEQHEEANIQ
jgi:hypothetical protein